VDPLVRIGLHVRIGPAGGEQERAVGQERRPARFARGGARQPASRHGIGRVDLPEGGGHLLALCVGPAYGDDEAAAVRAEAE